MKNTFFSFLLLFFSFSLASQCPDGFIAYYPFNNTSDDNCEGEYHASVHGAELTEDRFGTSNEAYIFDGEDDYLVVDDSNLPHFTTGGFTVTMWVKKLAPSNDWTNTFAVSQWGQGGITQGNNEWTIGLSSDGYDNIPTFAVESGMSRISVKHTEEINLNEWYHLAGRYDGNFIALFVNGQFISHANANQPINNVGRNLKFAVNDLGTSILYSNIVLDDVMIFEDDLTDDEIMDVYNGEFTNDLQIINPIEISIYPNPSRGIININEPAQLAKNVNIYDSVGRLIFQGNFESEINVNFKQSGIYFIEILDKDGEILKTEKIIGLSPRA